mgnify:CR=1 FL=1
MKSYNKYCSLFISLFIFIHVSFAQTYNEGETNEETITKNDIELSKKFFDNFGPKTEILYHHKPFNVGLRILTGCSIDVCTFLMISKDQVSQDKRLLRLKNNKKSRELFSLFSFQTAFNINLLIYFPFPSFKFIYSSVLVEFIKLCITTSCSDGYPV